MRVLTSRYAPVTNVPRDICWIACTQKLMPNRLEMHQCLVCKYTELRHTLTAKQISKPLSNSSSGYSLFRET